MTKPKTMTEMAAGLSSEMRAWCVRYAGENFDKQRMITKNGLLDEWSDKEWNLIDFKTLIDETLDKIPSTSRISDAKVVFRTGGYDESGRLTIEYEGLESQQAVDDRIARSIAYAEAHVTSEQKERAEYERLRAKYG